MDPKLAHQVRIAQMAKRLIIEAGISEDDPDFAAILENETDALEMLRDVIREVEREKAEAEAIKTIIQKNEGRIVRKLDRARRLENIVMEALGELGETKLRAPDFKAAVVPGPIKVVGNGDVATLPDQFVRIKREPDKTAIKAALASGQPVAGFELANGAPYLRITK